MENFTPASKGQIGQIVALLVAEKVSSDEAQAFIDAYRDRPSAKERRKQQKKRLDGERLAFWEGRFPGKGAALMDILRPFYDWKPERKPAMPDLEGQAKKAVHWREVNGVKVYNPSLWDSLWLPLRDSLRASFWDSLMASLGNSLMASLWESHGYSLWESLFFACGLVLANKPEEAGKLKPLLELWLAGNFPVGFDKDGNLLVLVAP